MISSPDSKQKGLAFIVAASLCWSLGGLCIKFIPWGALSIIGLRAFFAAIVFAIYRRSVRVNLTRGNIIGALCLSSTTILFVFANKLTSAAAAICLQFTAPIFIILIELVLFKKRPRPIEIIAVLATCLGMLLFFADKLESGALLGNLLAVGSGLAFAGVFICNKRPDVKSEDSLFLGFLINSMIGIPYAIFNVTSEPAAWGAILFLGFIQVGLAYVFFSIGIKTTPALLACLISALEPILNPVWVALFFHEIPGIFAIFGSVVIIITVVIYSVLEQRQSSKSTNETT